MLLQYLRVLSTAVLSSASMRGFPSSTKDHLPVLTERQLFEPTDSSVVSVGQ